MGAAVAAALVLDGILFALAGLGLKGAEGAGRNGAGPELPPLLVVLSPPASPAPSAAESTGVGSARAISGGPSSEPSAEASPQPEAEAGVPSAEGAAVPAAGPGAEAPEVSPESPTSPVSLAADTAEGEARLHARIDALIRDRLVYPAAARRRNTQGTVTVVLRISSAGTLDSLELAESSGSPVLDRAALSLFSRIFPLDPPLPGTSGSVSLRVQVAYILR